MRAAIVAFLTLLVLSAAGVFVRSVASLRYGAEAAAVLLGLGLALAVAARSLDHATLRAPFVRTLAALLCVCALAQIVKLRAAFPFMPFTMFAHARTPPAVYYRYSAQLASGAVEPFVPADAAPSLAYGRAANGLRSRFDTILEREAAGRDASRERALARAGLLALMRMHDARVPDSRHVVTLSVQRVELPRPYAPELARAREVMRVTPGGGP